MIGVFAVALGRVTRARLERDMARHLTPDLLKPAYRRRVEAGEHPLTGHCYVASEAAYHLLGGKAAGWTPVTVRHEGGPHWFLRHRYGVVLDLTAAQFRTPVPYELGRPCGFLTREPSKRARVVMTRLARNAQGSAA